MKSKSKIKQPEPTEEQIILSLVKRVILNASQTQIEIEGALTNGDIFFSVADYHRLGLTEMDVKGDPYLKNRHVVNFIGDALVRSNLVSFCQVMMPPTAWNDRHLDFGMVIKENKMTMQFHISYVASMLAQIALGEDDAMPTTDRIRRSIIFERRSSP
jgi:hypothetical protein